MEKFFEKITRIFDLFVNYAVLFIELIGVIILVYSVVKAVIDLLKKNDHIRLRLAEGIALALEFKIGGELLHTVIVREWNELLILGCIILMRAALTFLIQWEIKIEKKESQVRQALKAEAELKESKKDDEKESKTD